MERIYNFSENEGNSDIETSQETESLIEQICI